jgi:hypothetical protein
MKAKQEVKELKVTVSSLQQEMVVMQGGAPPAVDGASKDDAMTSAADDGSSGGWWQWLTGGAPPTRSEGGAHLEARHAQLILALWGMAAALSESENVRAMDVEVLKKETTRRYMHMCVASFLFEKENVGVLHELRH